LSSAGAALSAAGASSAMLMDPFKVSEMA